MCATVGGQIDPVLANSQQATTLNTNTPPVSCQHGQSRCPV